ncbi:hypothetical protein B0T21DRAFT_409940 [Apiosordaria backusii]|uniref:C2H2-type domain-containing protein n=1 Tax=Apiosordaria backusii TaxID=314023 RepID=A0AA40BSK9_9PEZI|nr:hypothetical protein B0T21DRAFT_409940 [Apiosordaria backusii]
MRVFQAFDGLSDLKYPNNGAPQKHFTIEAQRFRLWAYSLGLQHQGHSSLDYRVRDAALVKTQLLRMLSTLHDHLENILSILRGDRPPFEQQAQDIDNQSSSDDESTRSSNQSSGGSISSDESSHELDFRQKGVAETIDALYSLAARIRNSRTRPERTTQELFRHIAAHEREQYIKERAEVEAVILVHRHKQYLVQTFQKSNQDTVSLIGIIEKYASGSHYLMKRIGMANVRRRQQFIYWKEHAARISRDPAHTVASTGSKQPTTSESLFQIGKTRAAHTHLTTPSVITRQEHSEATSATRLDEGRIRFDDDQSVFSYQSYASTTATPQSQVLLQWPPPPKDLLAGDYFTCPYCHVICPGRYLVEKAWKAHLIHDLRPYQCTYEVCQDPNRLYGSYQDWIDHENLHTKAWHCDYHLEPREFETQEDYIAHLQQLHPSASQELFTPELMAAAFRPSTRPLRMCPLCPTGFENVRKMHEHIKGHLERLAHHCLPAGPLDKDEDDGSRGSADSVRQVVRNNEGSQALSDTSLQWDDDMKVLESQDLGGYTATHNFGDICREFKQTHMERESWEAWLDTVAEGHQQIVRLLLEHGASASAWDDANGSVLELASNYGHREIVQLLLDYGADINTKPGRYGGALEAASKGGHRDIVQLLLEHGAEIDPKSTNYASFTQLMRAAAIDDKGDEDVIVTSAVSEDEQETGDLVEESSEPVSRDEEPSETRPSSGDFIIPVGKPADSQPSSSVQAEADNNQCFTCGIAFHRKTNMKNVTVTTVTVTSALSKVVVVAEPKQGPYTGTSGFIIQTTLGKTTFPVGSQVACDWPGREYRGRRDNLKRHKAIHLQQRQDIPSSSNIQQEKPLEALLTDIPHINDDEKDQDWDSPSDNYATQEDILSRDKMKKNEVITSGDNTTETSAPAGNNTHHENQGLDKYDLNRYLKQLEEQANDSDEIGMPKHKVAQTAEAIFELVQTYVQLDRSEEAVTALVQLRETMKQHFGELNLDVLASTSYLGLLYSRQGRWGEAVPLQEQFLQGWTQHVRENSFLAVSIMENLADIYDKLGRSDHAKALRGQIKEILEKGGGKHSVIPGLKGYIDRLDTICKYQRRLVGVDEVAEVLAEIREEEESRG